VIQKIQIGFWAERRGDLSGLPWPGDRVDPMFEPEARRRVLAYLQREKFRGDAYKGVSSCRLCGMSNGSCDFTDGAYLWPEGYAHYIEQHNVMPERTFIAHVLTQPAEQLTMAEQIMAVIRTGSRR